MKDVLMWTVFVALSASRDVVMRGAFIVALRRAEPGIFRLGYAEVKKRHERVVWRESKCSDALDNIWKEVTNQSIGLRL